MNTDYGTLPSEMKYVYECYVVQFEEHGTQKFYTFSRRDYLRSNVKSLNGKGHAIFVVRPKQTPPPNAHVEPLMAGILNSFKL